MPTVSRWATTSAVDSRSSEIGFSQKVGRDASAAAWMRPAWASVAAAMTTASLSSTSSSTESAARTPSSSASSAARGRSASATRSSTSSRSASAVACTLPIRPTPMTPIRTPASLPAPTFLGTFQALAPPPRLGRRRVGLERSKNWAYPRHLDPACQAGTDDERLGEDALDTTRLTVAQAIVRYMIAQRTEIDGEERPLFPGVYAIFGHGNVTCLGDALEAVRDELPTWRGQNEQTMAMAGVAYAKAMRRRQIMVATTSIGPGALNMVTAAGIAHANRLPLLMLSGETFASRLNDPVLQQVEHFGDPTVTANDAFKAVTRYWDRIVRPEQVLQSLPQAVATMLDPADCGPAFIGLAQDVQAMSFDYPDVFFEPRVHRIRRPGADPGEIASAAEALRGAERPLLIAGGGVRYSIAEDALAAFAEMHGVPVVETVAGKSGVRWAHPSFGGPIGVTGSSSANALAAEADVVLAVGTRLQDFTTGSWSVFRNEGMRLIALNAARFDATKHRALSVVGDALRGLEDVGAALGDWRAPSAWGDEARRAYAEWNDELDSVAAAPAEGAAPSYAAVIRTVNELVADDDYVV